MANKFTAVFSIPEALKQGKMVANPVAWKQGQITVAFLAGFLGMMVAVLPLFGYTLDVDEVTLNSIAGGILAVYGVYNQVATAASTDKVGITGKAHSVKS
jgi:hypothetical protein